MHRARAGEGLLWVLLGHGYGKQWQGPTDCRSPCSRLCHCFLAYISQQIIGIPVGIILPLLMLLGAYCLFLKYQSRVKYWFQAPPNIPEQIKEVSAQIGRPSAETRFSVGGAESWAGWHTPEIPAPPWEEALTPEGCPLLSIGGHRPTHVNPHTIKMSKSV